MRQKIKIGLLTLLLLLGGARGAFANRVLSVTSNEEQVTLTNESTKRRWQLNEAVCLIKNGDELACGFVGRLTETTLVIKIESRNAKVQAGLDVLLQREGRVPTSNEDVATSGRSDYTVAPRKIVADVTLGPVVGLNYFFPVVPSVQIPLGRGFSLGVDFRFTQFTKLGVAANAIGGTMNVTYYSARQTFRGLFFALGLGLYSLDLRSGATAETQMPLAVQGLVGWRAKPRWGFGIDLGVAGGVQYVTKKSATLLANDFGGIMPVVSVFLGYSF